jgi:excisionase family DNA binding protein
MNAPIIPDDEEPLRIKAVAKALGISDKTVRRWIDHGKLVSVKMGGLRVIRRRDFDEFWKKLNPTEAKNV